MVKPLVKGVLWDFGGVLSTSPFDAFGAYEVANGLEAGFIRRLNSTNPDTNAWAQLERSEVDLETFARLFEAEAEAAGGKVEGAALLAGLQTEIRPAMIEAVRRCREQMMKTALLTNNFSAGNGSMWEGVPELFDVIVESSQVGYRKPDPHLYAIALEMLDIEPAEAVFLDDLGINLKPARALGMHTIKVTDPADALAELEALVGFALG
jgi:putative hydrolase of the HAD superfamily